jgi:hypothetical protein
MTNMTIAGGRPEARFRAGSAALMVLALTCVHHAYGAVAFDTPWRLHIIFFAVPAAIIIVALLYVAGAYRHETRGRLALWTGALLILAFPVAMIGFYEGGYNHLVKNIVFFVGGENAARSLFPAPTYEMPSDKIFEITGIAQFPLSVLTTVMTIGMLRERRR